MATKTKAQAELDALDGKIGELGLKLAELEAKKREVLTGVQDEAIEEFTTAVKAALEAAKAKGVAVDKLASKLPKALRITGTGTTSNGTGIRQRRADYVLHDKLKANGSSIGLRDVQAGYEQFKAKHADATWQSFESSEDLKRLTAKK
jgi:hypothetical protein